MCFLNVACGCNVRGVEKGDLTCNNTGSCNCRCDVVGDKCNMCQVGHQGFPDCDGMSINEKLCMCIQKNVFRVISNENCCMWLFYHWFVKFYLWHCWKMSLQSRLLREEMWSMSKWIHQRPFWSMHRYLSLFSILSTLT